MSARVASDMCVCGMCHVRVGVWHEQVACAHLHVDVQCVGDWRKQEEGKKTKIYLWKICNFSPTSFSPA